MILVEQVKLQVAVKYYEFRSKAQACWSELQYASTSVGKIYNSSAKFNKVPSLAKSHHWDKTSVPQVSASSS